MFWNHKFPADDQSTDNGSGTRNHVVVGGALCTLAVKVDAWTQRFPNRRSGSPMKRAEFIRGEMRQGLEGISVRIEDALNP
ncbi:MAG: hypothetical protein O3A84_17005 [Proteobacteria bacterium]|nr:hypothetical protein [Pseudomonadota bacterium]